MLYLGIDLGTSYTKAAVYDTSTNKTTLVTLNVSNINDNEDIKYYMPTAFCTNNEGNMFEVGIEAVNMKLYADDYYVENFKSNMDKENPYAICNPNITYVQVLISILTHIRERATIQFMSSFKKIVLTVPASTIKGGNYWKRMEEAALKVFGPNASITIIYEPEAAGFGLIDKHILSNSTENKQYFLVYDFGGGTFDASLLKVEDGQIFVIRESVGSDDKRHWGGIYIDDILRRDYRMKSSKVQELINNRGNLDARQLHSLKQILQMEPRKAKINLSLFGTYKYSLGDYVLEKECYELLTNPMINDTINSCTELINLKGGYGDTITYNDIHTIFLVGGSSKIPKIAEIWNKKKKDENLSFNIETSNLSIVAIGAAKFHVLKIEPKTLVISGIKRMIKKDYNKAAMYFFNAGNDEGFFLLGVLYYEGLIGSNVFLSDEILNDKDEDRAFNNLTSIQEQIKDLEVLIRDYSTRKLNAARNHDFSLASDFRKQEVVYMEQLEKMKSKLTSQKKVNYKPDKDEKQTSSVQHIKSELSLRIPKYRRAIEYFKKSNLKEARLMLSILYFQGGKGCMKDLEKALYYFPKLEEPQSFIEENSKDLIYKYARDIIIDNQLQELKLYYMYEFSPLKLFQKVEDLYISKANLLVDHEEKPS